MKNAIIPKRLRKTVSSPAYNVKHLHLFLSSPLSFTRYAIGELVDSLLWISPLLDILTIEAGSIFKPDDYDKISFKVLYLFIHFLESWILLPIFWLMIMLNSALIAINKFIIVKYHSCYMFLLLMLSRFLFHVVRILV